MAYCWGQNFDGQLGDGTTTDRSTPVAVQGGHSFQQLTTGAVHTCGVTTDSLAYCWGHNLFGQLGNGTTTSSTLPVAVLGRGVRLAFRQLSAGNAHTCGVTTGAEVGLANVPYCWGANFSGELGDGTTASTTQPATVQGGLAFRQVNAGGGFTCGVTTDNVAYCWGSNLIGQLGDSTTTNSTLPVAVGGGLVFRGVIAGAFLHTCGLTTANVAYCWGSNGDGELGNSPNDIPFHLTPIAVEGGLAFRQLNTGSSYSCGVGMDNVAYCWGENFGGQLGDGTTDERSTPRPVEGGLRFRQVAAKGSFAHTCAVTTGNLAYCWGNNLFGQLGDGTTTHRRLPVAVAPPAP